MNPDIKQQWITALRSGDYEQGAGQLKTAEGTYCCLGVLMDLAVKAGVAEEMDDSIEGTSYRYIGEDSAELSEVFEYHSLVSFNIQSWSGIDSTTGELPRHMHGMEFCEAEGLVCAGHPVAASSLMQLNDSLKFTFDQIADVIEEQF